MAVITQSLTANGAGTPFTIAAGVSTIVVSGNMQGGELDLEISIDDTNYGSAGKQFRGPGAANIEVSQACSGRWLVSGARTTPAITVSVEGA